MAGRDRHEWGADGDCIHCGEGRVEDSTSASQVERLVARGVPKAIAEKGLRAVQDAERCADRQRRHDAFVASALRRLYSQDSATDCTSKEMAADAVRVADAIMAELAKP